MRSRLGGINRRKLSPTEESQSERSRLLADIRSAGFEDTTLHHLDAAHNLTRWLVGSGTDAEDLVQEASLRAWRGFVGFRGRDGRSWLLTVVRNTCFKWLRENHRQGLAVEFNEDLHREDVEVPEAERLLAESSGLEMLAKSLQELPVQFREAIVLRARGPLLQRDQRDYGRAGRYGDVATGANSRTLADLPGAAGGNEGVKCTAKKPGT
jgi:RNA polymerase sigma factor (sigma-70 family)